MKSLKIPLNLPAIAVGASIVAAQRAWRRQAGPPFLKGDIKGTVLKLMTLTWNQKIDSKVIKNENYSFNPVPDNKYQISPQLNLTQFSPLIREFVLFMAENLKR